MALEVTCHPSTKRTNQVAEMTLSFLFLFFFFSFSFGDKYGSAIFIKEPLVIAQFLKYEKIMHEMTVSAISACCPIHLAMVLAEAASVAPACLPLCPDLPP